MPHASSRRWLPALLIAGGLAWSPPAQAQFSQYLLPVEKAFTESHLDLQFQLSRLEWGVLETNVALLSVEAQLELGALELGLNLPLLAHGWGPLGRYAGSDTQFGDMILSLKSNLLRQRSLGVALFVNTTLPTHSGDYSHDYALLHNGVSITGRVRNMLIGGNVQTLWLIHDGQDDLLLGFNGFVEYWAMRFLTLAFAMEFHNSVLPNSSLTALGLTPGVVFHPVTGLRLGLATRIAATDEAKLLYLGRASLLFHFGYRFD